MEKKGQAKLNKGGGCETSEQVQDYSRKRKLVFPLDRLPLKPLFVKKRFFTRGGLRGGLKWGEKKFDGRGGGGLPPIRRRWGRTAPWSAAGGASLKDHLLGEKPARLRKGADKTPKKGWVFPSEKGVKKK